MKHVIALLLAATVLAGCSSVGNVFKKTGQVLMDPSIQVGSADDQPTQVALSLYASADVNPNPVSCAAAGPMDDREPALVGLEEQGPFAVNLHSASKDELVAHLQALLGHLEPGTTSSSGALAVRQRLAIPGLVVDEQAPPLTLGKSQPETLFAGTATARRPVPSTWMLRQAPEKALGSTLLASDDYILVPGQFKLIEFAAVDEHARYIAVVADFHAPNAERWHDVFRIEPRGRKYPLLVMLQGSRVAITDESYRPVRSPVCTGPQASNYR